MDIMGTYVLSVIATAVLCTLAMQIVGQKGTVASIIRMICGLIMVSAVIRPLGKTLIPNITGYFDELDIQTSAAVYAGTEYAQQALIQRITQQTCSYIQDRAKELGVELIVRIEVDDSALPIPVRAELSGNVSPAAKAKLEQIIEEDLGIGKEDQIWK